MSEKSTNEVLELLLQRLKIDKGGPISQLHLRWGEIIGYDLINHVKLLDLRGKVLIIEADHPTWSSIIMMRREEIIGRLKAQYPQLGITQIQVRVRSTPKSKSSVT